MTFTHLFFKVHSTWSSSKENGVNSDITLTATYSMAGMSFQEVNSIVLSFWNCKLEHVKTSTICKQPSASSK